MNRQIVFLGMVVLAATNLVGCAVCDTCDDFPAPCLGPNCGGGSGALPNYLGGGQGYAVMGTNTPVYSAGAADDAAPSGPTMPPAADAPATSAPAAPAVNPAPGQ